MVISQKYLLGQWDGLADKGSSCTQLMTRFGFPGPTWRKKRSNSSMTLTSDPQAWAEVNRSFSRVRWPQRCGSNSHSMYTSRHKNSGSKHISTPTDLLQRGPWPPGKTSSLHTTRVDSLLTHSWLPSQSGEVRHLGISSCHSRCLDCSLVSGLVTAASSLLTAKPTGPFSASFYHGHLCNGAFERCLLLEHSFSSSALPYSNQETTLCLWPFLLRLPCRLFSCQILIILPQGSILFVSSLSGSSPATATITCNPPIYTSISLIQFKILILLCFYVFFRDGGLTR